MRHVHQSNQAPQVQIVVLNWNGKEDTLACLASVGIIDRPSFRVIVADNGSRDDSVVAIRQAYPQVEVLENGGNLGFAAGNNAAITHALGSGSGSGTEFILLLNNDTVVDPGILAAFVDAAERMPDCGVFGAKIYYFDQPETLWFAGGYWDSKTLHFGERGAGERDHGQFDALTETEWVIGCAMFIRTEVFHKIGLLEPDFFLNNEEIDFCSRAKRAGFGCAFVPDARLWHKISASFGGENSPLKEYFSARNRLLWARRNAPPVLRLRIYMGSAFALAQRFLRPAWEQARGAPMAPRSWWWSLRAAFRDPRNRAAAQGFRDFWLRRFGNCPDGVRELAREWKTRSAAPAAPGPQFN